MLRHPIAGWVIRPHDRADAVEIERVFLDCLEFFPKRLPQKSNETERLRYLLRTSTVLVAEEENAGIIGFLILQSDAAYVSHLFVDADWRFCGVGSGLLEIARGLTRRPLCLDVDEDNSAAIAVYERLGWIETAEHGRPGQGQKRLCGR